MAWYLHLKYAMIILQLFFEVLTEDRPWTQHFSIQTSHLTSPSHSLHSMCGWTFREGQIIGSLAEQWPILPMEKWDLDKTKLII